MMLYNERPEQYKWWGAEYTANNKSCCHSMRVALLQKDDNLCLSCLTTGGCGTFCLDLNVQLQRSAALHCAHQNSREPLITATASLSLQALKPSKTGFKAALHSKCVTAIFCSSWVIMSKYPDGYRAYFMPGCEVLPDIYAWSGHCSRVLGSC